MFLGTFKTYFSGRNRIVLPKKFRKEIQQDDNFYIVRGMDGEIWGFNKEEWQKETEKRLNVPLSDSQGRISRRRFFSLAEECVLDGQGRFVITQELVDYAGLKEEVLMVGAGDHFEVWDPERFSRAVDYKL